MSLYEEKTHTTTTGKQTETKPKVQKRRSFDDLLSFLNTKKTWDSKNYTHTMLFPTAAKYNIDKESFDTFWKMYFEAIKIEKIGLTELPQLYAQVVVDIDISLKNKGQDLSSNFYSSKHVKTVVEIYQNVLKEIVTQVTDDQLSCIVLSKKPYIKKNNISNGFHLQFPNLFLNQQQQEVYLIPKIKRNLKESNVFENLGIKDSSEVIDKVYKKTWLLYGSVKGENMEPYEISHGYKYVNGKTMFVDANEILVNCTIYDSNDNEIKLSEKNVKKYVSQILSIFPFERKTNQITCTGFLDMRKLLPDKKMFSLEAGNGNENSNTAKKYGEIPFEKQMKDLKAMSRMLDVKRANDFNLWFEIGTIIYNVSRGSREGLDVWLEFSKRCEEKFDEQSCYYYWNRYYIGNVSIGTLIYYVKQDNPEEYKRYKEAETRSFVANMSANHYDVAEFMYRQYREVYVCSNIKGNEWYNYFNHAWHECEEGYSLEIQIPKLLFKKLLDVKKMVKRSIDRLSAKPKASDSDDEHYDSDEECMKNWVEYDDEKTEEEKDKDKKKEVEAKEKHLNYISKLMNNLKMAPFCKKCHALCKTTLL